MRVLITGCAGFIGSNLTNKCLELGWHVVGVDDMSNGHVEFLNPEFVRQENRFMRMDFIDPAILSSIRNNDFDVVMHLAAMPRVSYSVECPVETHETNVNKTLKLLEACKGNINRFVFASSSSVYGESLNLPTEESERKNPMSPYALQKSIIEDYLGLYYKYYDLDSVSLRFFNVFGPNQLGGSPYSTAVSSWLFSIKEGKSMRSDGDGSQSRDMCYVDNVVDACVRTAMYQPRLKSICLNVACGESVTNNQILDYLKSKYPDSISHTAPSRLGDVKHTLASIKYIETVLGYVPIVKTWEGIDKTINWINENWNDIKRMKTNI